MEANMGNDMALQMADVLEKHVDEACDVLISSFLEQFPDSQSLKLSKRALEKWSANWVRDLADVLKGRDYCVPNMGAYVGDTSVNVSTLIDPMVTMIESWLFVSRTLAPFFWRIYAEDLAKSQKALEELEKATTTIVNGIVQAFCETQLVPGCLTHEWITRSSEENGDRARHARYDADNSLIPLAGLVSSMAHKNLTRKETEIVVLVAAGKTNGEIAAEMNIAQSTVKNHVSRIFDKMNVNTRTELTRAAIDLGIV